MVYTKISGVYWDSKDTFIFFYFIFFFGLVMSLFLLLSYVALFCLVSQPLSFSLFCLVIFPLLWLVWQPLYFSLLCLVLIALFCLVSRPLSRSLFNLFFFYFFFCIAFLIFYSMYHALYFSYFIMSLVIWLVNSPRHLFDSIFSCFTSRIFFLLCPFDWPYLNSKCLLDPTKTLKL